MTTQANNNRFARTEKLLGSQALEQLKSSFVVVVGLGAVGSYATEALARSGIGNLRLVDFDTVHISNVNRQLYALGSTIGQPKTEVAETRVRDINPACHVEALNCFAHEDTLPQILAPLRHAGQPSAPPDLVIDAIDSLNPKVILIHGAVAAGIPVVSSMGAATRTDLSQIRYGDLFLSSNCRLARHLRKRLRRRGIQGGIFSVYSQELTARSATRFEESEGTLRDSPDEVAGDDAAADGPPTETAPDGLRQNGRKREILGSMPTVTGMFGLALAHHAILSLAGVFTLPEPVYQGGR